MPKHTLLLALLALLTAAACQPTTQHEPQTTTYEYQPTDTTGMATDGQVLESLMKLDEVQATNKHIDSLSNHTKGVALQIVERPAENEQHSFVVKVGYDGDTRFETYYIFYVDGRTLAVSVEDLATGDIVPIAQWRAKTW